MLTQAHHTLSVSTRGRDFVDITSRVAAWLGERRAENGVLTLFIQHTSASLVIQENADPDVLADLRDSLAELAPEGRRYRHSIEGPDDMPAHVKAAVTSTSLQVPVIAGRMALGTWQAIYVAEHRARAHDRRVVLFFQGAFGKA